MPIRFSLLFLFAAALPLRAAEPVRFARDVLPILSDKCFQCHGPDEKARKAKLRLDRPETVADKGVIVPGAPDTSELVKRICATDDTRMPPATAGKTLTAKEAELLRHWIEQGAKWERHWSLVPPIRPNVPNLGEPRQHPIDAFVRARLAKEGLKPSPEAPRHTLIRRLSYDLIGMPPTPVEVDTFVNDTSADAYEKVVNRLLASRHFGERMAMPWLDAARYSDSDGYEHDDERTNWPWRDWVIDSFNANKPFDQFTIEQFAGDLLPNATAQQKLATCFHRNHMTNGEGGRDSEESRIDYVIDRVNTTGTLWMGLTVGCAQCHDHKFDPLSQREYYRLFAFFNSIAEDGKAGRLAKPYLKFRSPYAGQTVAAAEALVKQRTAELQTSRAEAAQGFDEWLDEQRRSVTAAQAYRAWQPLTPRKLEATDGSILRAEADGTIRSTGPDPYQEDYRIYGRPALERITGMRLEVLPDPSFPKGGLSRSPDGNFILTGLRVSIRHNKNSLVRPVPIPGAVADFEAEKPKNEKGFGPIRDVLDDDPRTGWTTRGKDPREPRVAIFAFAQPLNLSADEELYVELLQRSLQGHVNIGRFRLSFTDQAGPVVNSVEVPPLEQLANLGASKEIPAALNARLLDQYLADRPAYLKARAALERARKTLTDAKRSAGDVDVMVLEERKTPRSTHVLVRGVWNSKGDELTPGSPAALAPWPANLPANRLGLARWLVQRDQPLTARVTVNGYWQLLFGTGLVRTPEDFGMQGEPPTHPELLDWLAVEFMDHGWDVKHILKVMVTSATYRQSSSVTPELLARDPNNRWLARASRFRLPSWMLRDGVLRESGLLSPVIGGPPLRPYQPDGVWAELTMGRFQYDPSEGPEQYRRTIYAFWRRSVAPAFLFDTAQRRTCEVKVVRTNTPLQALTLMNDLTATEAARAMTGAVLLESPASKDRLTSIYRHVLARAPTPSELAILERQLRQALDYYQQNPAQARRLLAQGQWRSSAKLDPAEHAAYAVVAGLVLNLDEAVTRE